MTDPPPSGSLNILGCGSTDPKSCVENRDVRPILYYLRVVNFFSIADYLYKKYGSNIDHLPRLNVVETDHANFLPRKSSIHPLLVQYHPSPG